LPLNTFNWMSVARASILSSSILYGIWTLLKEFDSAYILILTAKFD